MHVMASMPSASILITFVLILFGYAFGQDNAPSTTTASDACVSYNNSCSDCISSNALCVWCSGRCVAYSTGGGIFPDSCPRSEAKWLNCWVNVQVLLITMCIIGVIIFVVLVTCVYCCCCSTNQRRARQREQREDERSNRAKSDRQARSSERKAERESRYAELRRKYGLARSGSTPFDKFENDDTAAA